MRIASKTVIQVSGTLLFGYQLESGQWVMSLTTLVNVLNIPLSKVRWDLISNTQVVKGWGSVPDIEVVDIQVAEQYLGRFGKPLLKSALDSQGLRERFEGTKGRH